MKTLALLAVTLLSAAAASQTVAPRGEIVDPIARICKADGETGSRLGRTRTCKTRAEWDAQRQDQRATLDRAQTRQLNRTIDEVGKFR